LIIIVWFFIGVVFYRIHNCNRRKHKDDFEDLMGINK
jgi:hypothetical protein